MVAYVSGNPFSTYLFSDGQYYMRWASRIASGEAPREVFYQAPLYPYLLSLFAALSRESLLPVYLLQHLLGLLSILLVWLIAVRFLPRPTAALAALLFAIHPYPAYLEEKVCPEPVALPLLLLALLLALRARERGTGWVWAGLASGLAAVARANFLLFGGALFVGLLRSRRRTLLSFGLPFLLLLLLPAARNYSIDGSLVLVAANGGEVFYHGNNPNARGVMGMLPELPSEVDLLADSSRRVAGHEIGRDVNAGEASVFWFRKGIAWIVGNGSDYSSLMLRKARLLLSGNYIPLGNFFLWEAARFPGVPAWLRFLHYPLLLLAVAGLLHPASRKRTPQLLYVYAMVPVVTVLVFFVSTRYLVPLIPAVALLAGSALAYGTDRRGRIAMVLLTPLAIILAVADGKEEHPRSTPFAQLASIRADQGRGEEAVRLYREALDLAPWDLRHYQNLAAEQERQGDRAGAAATIETAVRRGLADGRTLGYYGALLLLLGRQDEAEAILRRALRIEPRRARTHLELARTLEASLRLEEAAAEYKEAARLDPSLIEPQRALLRIYTTALPDSAGAREAERMLRRLEEGGLVEEVAHPVEAGTVAPAVP